jgi:hypothetical protein
MASATNYGKVPKRAARLGWRALRVLVAIAAYADKDGVAYPSLDRIAADTGILRLKVPDAVAELERAGFLRRLRAGGRGKTNRYQIIFDQPETVPAAGTVLGGKTVPAAGTVCDQKQCPPWTETVPAVDAKQCPPRAPEQTIEQNKEHIERGLASRAPSLSPPR